MSMVRAYLFEAKGIQRYVLDGDRLIDMTGASELVDFLARRTKDDLLEEVLNASGFPEPRNFSRRAGGAFMLHYAIVQQPEFDRFRRLWRLSVQILAPGMEFSETIRPACADDKAALDDAYKNASPMRHNSLAHQLPLAGPLVRRSPRTGLAVVGTHGNEEVDAVTMAKRKAEDVFIKTQQGGPLTSRLLGKTETTISWRWPRMMEADDNSGGATVLMPFEGRERWLGVIHADVSGLGQTVQRFSEGLESGPDMPARFLKFSEKIAGCIEAAAQFATAEVLLPAARKHTDIKQQDIIPARPILLGGDDLTIIVRADLAISFASSFLEKLEVLTEKELPGIFESIDTESQPKRLSACAGIAFIKSKQPFYMASTLAENLCKYAKGKVKADWDRKGANPPASAIAFHRITTSAIDENFDSIIKRELTAGARTLSRQPYLVGCDFIPGLSRLEHLKDLANVINDSPGGKGPLRQLKKALFTDQSQAIRGYKNWHKTVALQVGGKFARDEFDRALAALHGQLEDDAGLPFDTNKCTALFDALELRELQGTD